MVTCTQVLQTLALTIIAILVVSVMLSRIRLYIVRFHSLHVTFSYVLQILEFPILMQHHDTHILTTGYIVRHNSAAKSK
jgi:hypothetical protein